MNLFECVLKTSSGGGSGADLVVTCASNFAGATITCTDGGSNTFTEVCPSTSPYTVTFESIPVGTYTISGVVSGQTFSTTTTILDFTANLNDIPDGSTVTPVNDIQTWLHCANIWDKNYSTIAAVLADTTTLLALISSNNAVDYMTRSTSWASSVCANQTAMGYIGNNDYCAETLLANATWCEAICNSTYFESVLNVKVPTMTSDTTPSGVVTVSSCESSQYGHYSYGTFDNNDNTDWYASTNTGQYVQYAFPSQVLLKKLEYYPISQYTGQIYTITLKASNDGASFTPLYTKTGVPNTGQIALLNNNTTKYSIYRLEITCENPGQYSIMANAKKIQYYGRA